MYILTLDCMYLNYNYVHFSLCSDWPVLEILIEEGTELFELPILGLMNLVPLPPKTV